MPTPVMATWPAAATSLMPAWPAATTPLQQRTPCPSLMLHLGVRILTACLLFAPLSAPQSPNLFPNLAPPWELQGELDPGTTIR
jgi:hypothetical protein